MSGAAALSAAFLLTPAGHAQSTTTAPVDNRFLFIFGTSDDMKKRVPAVQEEINNLLSHNLGDQLRAGDSVGVWTFDQNLRTGQFPLQPWNPALAGTIASNINKFVGKQKYSKRTSFNALQPRLNQVIQRSEQLTVLIFCDGEDQIKWTPYDAGINQVLQQRQADMKKAHEPFVLVLRTQLGEYIGCTVNFPPGMVNFPEFPPLQAPEPEKKAMRAAAPPAAPTNPAPLIIIGRKVETNWPPVVTNSAPPIVTNLAPVLPTNPPPLAANNAEPSVPSNPTPVAVTEAPPAMPTQAVAAVTTNLVASGTPPAPEPENVSATQHKGELVLGIALLAAAGALVVLIFSRGQRARRNSLITRSMEKE
jgi:hypothetical protein